MYQILFVCTANLCRSPLAAAFFLRKLQAEGRSHEWTVQSAGTWTITGRHVSQEILAAAAAMGLDLSGHRTQRIDGNLLARHDLVLVMEKGHREALRMEFPSFQKKVHLLSVVADQMEYDVADPMNSDLNMYEIVVEISRLIDRAYPNICSLVQQPRVQFDIPHNE